MIDLDLMRKASQYTSKILEEIYEYTTLGMKTKDIEEFCKKRMAYYNVKSASYGYNGTFPGHCCISINHEMCHGFYSNYVIKKDDIISIDVSLSYMNHYGDSCISFIMGQGNNLTKRLLKCAFDAVHETIKLVKPDVSLGTLGNKMSEVAKRNKFSVVEEFCGHFIGRKLHLLPDVLAFGSLGQGYKLKEGDCFTIEPIILEKKDQVTIDMDDQWTAFSQNGYLSAQFEHTVLVTKNGYEILTKNKLFDKNLNLICKKN